MNETFLDHTHLVSQKHTTPSLNPIHIHLYIFVSSYTPVSYLTYTCSSYSLPTLLFLHPYTCTSPTLLSLHLLQFSYIPVPTPIHLYILQSSYVPVPTPIHLYILQYSYTPVPTPPTIFLHSCSYTHALVHPTVFLHSCSYTHTLVHPTVFLHSCSYTHTLVHPTVFLHSCSYIYTLLFYSFSTLLYSTSMYCYIYTFLWFYPTPVHFYILTLCIHWDPTSLYSKTVLVIGLHILRTIQIWQTCKLPSSWGCLKPGVLTTVVCADR